jgi:hypothetical protein
MGVNKAIKYEEMYNKRERKVEKSGQETTGQKERRMKERRWKLKR